MKKFLKIIGIFFGLLIVALIVAPFLLKGSLEDLLKKNINKNLNAQVEWASLDISLFRSFPDAAVRIEDFSVVNNAPFEGDTLASGKTITLDMGITQLFKSGNDAIAVNALMLDEAYVNIRIDSLGNANYDIAIDKETTELPSEETTNEGFTFDLKSYEIRNSAVNYFDEVAKTYLSLKELNHEGKGDFSLAVSELDTETTSLVSLQIGDVAYLNENDIALDAIFEMNLEDQKYTFLQNEATVNALPLTFDGYVDVNENSTEMDLKFKTPSSDFRNFLAVIPKTYVKNLDGVATTGDFLVNGRLNGVVDDNRIPKMNIAVRSNNASFKYPDLPKAVRNISIDATLKNDTGLVEDTYLTIGGLTFKIDDEIFSANGSIHNLTKNAIVNMALKGTLDLANIQKVMPIELKQNLSGVFKADVTTKFDMASIENEQYQSIKTNGTASLTGFNYRHPDFKHELKLAKVDMLLSPGNIKLNALEGSTGNSDISATGTIQNLIPWVMAKQDLKGRFNVRSNTFDLNDFSSTDTGLSNEGSNSKNASFEKEQIKIPDFLDATIDFTANKIIYDDITLTNTSGTVGIKNETANMQNVTSDIFGGNVALNGNVSTLEKTPTFQMNLDLNEISIAQSLNKSSLLNYIAPIAKALDGNFNTQLKLNGSLNDDLTPNLSSLAGDALAQIITAEVNSERTPIIAKISEKAPFLKLDKLSLKNLSTAIKFNNGNIEVQPFDFDVKGVNVTASGSHGLDKSMKYDLQMDVPARYLGSDVTKLLNKLDPSEANNMRVMVPLGIRGSITNPQINVDMKSAVSTITQKLVQKQTQELKDKGTDILKDIITGGDSKENKKTGGNKGTNNKTQTQKTTTEKTEKVVKDILGDIFGKKKKKDSINR